MSETEGTDLNAMEREPPIWTPPIGQISSGWQQAASLILCAALIVAGVYILSNYLRALVWALVLAVALWPAYDRLRRKNSQKLRKKALAHLGYRSGWLDRVFAPYGSRHRSGARGP